MSKYTKNSIEKLYGSDDDFILIGVTGRTGSGCSTVATILNSTQENLKHSLFQGNQPENNKQRSEKIIFNRFKNDWKPFLLIQVRSIITLMLAESKNQNKSEYKNFIKSCNINKSKTKQLNSILEIINNEFKEIQEDPTKYDNLLSFYNSFLPQKSEDIKDLLGIKFTKIFQRTGENIRKSGTAVKDTIEEGKFFVLAEKINSIIKEIRKQHKKTISLLLL